MQQVYVIVYRRNHRRVPRSPAFQYPAQAERFIAKRLANSRGLTYKRVR